MGLRRGVLLGFLMGAIAVVTSRRAQDEVDTPGSDANQQFKELLDEARSEARTEREATEQRLRRRFTIARESGHLPDEPDAPAQ